MSKPKSPEYKIRPVSRFVMTEYIEGPDSASSTMIGEFANRAQAQRVLRAFTGTDNNENAWNILPEHDVPAMLRNIAEDEAGFTTRGLVVLIQSDGSTRVYGLGAKVGDPGEILAAGRRELDKLYP